MTFLIVTQTPEAWATFAESLTEAQQAVRYVDTATLALDACRADNKPLLILWDDAFSGMTLRHHAIDVMMIDARIHQTACSAEAEDVFHEVTEGLGFLPAVPTTRSAHDAVTLLDALKKIGVAL